MTIDLSKIKQQLIEDVDQWSLKFNEGHRSHLGASMIGKPCYRELWYSFRWVQTPTFEPRMLRLFQTGHREEPRFIEMLEAVGFKVSAEQKQELYLHPESDSYMWLTEKEFNQQNDGFIEQVSDITEHIVEATKQGVKPIPKQHRISDCMGHFGGSLDGICIPPAKYGIHEECLLELKTNKTGADFTNMQKSGVSVVKPQHWAQMCTYGYKRALHYGFYVMKDKNTDALAFDVVELDYKLGKYMVQKAHDIILSETPPARISKSPNSMECKWCDFKEICFGSKLYEKNCRNCAYSHPVENAKWYCSKHEAEIPGKQEILEGCSQYEECR